MITPLGNRQRRWPGYLTVAAAVVAADQITKAVADSRACGPVVCPLRNDELMLGIAGRPAAGAVVVGIIGSTVFAVWAWAVLVRRSRPLLPIVVVAAGMVGNIVDRVRLGAVRDFLAGPSGTVFNVADVAVLGGLCACSVVALAARQPEPQPRAPTASPAPNRQPRPIFEIDQ